MAGGGALADLVLPRTCAGCGLPGAVLCRRCAALLARPRPATPRRFPWGFPPTAAAGAYSGPVRPAVNAFKEQGRAELAGPLGTALALAVAAVVSGGAATAPGPVLLVPVPSSRGGPAQPRPGPRAGADRRRGRRAARGRGCRPRRRRLLRRAGARVRDSAGLSAAASGGPTWPARFRPGRRPARPGARLVLVDDVVTSGATLTEAAAALSRGPSPGDPPVLAAVVAATPRRPAVTAPRRGDLRRCPERGRERPEAPRPSDCRDRR